MLRVLIALALIPAVAAGPAKVSLTEFGQKLINEAKADADEKQFPFFPWTVPAAPKYEWKAPQCAADIEFYEESLKPNLPREFVNTWSEAKVAFIETQPTRTQPTYQFVKKPYQFVNKVEPLDEMNMDPAGLPTLPKLDLRAIDQDQEILQKVHQVDPASKEASHETKFSKSAKQLHREMMGKKFESWYVNMPQDTARSECISSQLDDVGQKAHRFEALVFPDECVKEGANHEECLKERGFEDCVEAGVKHEAIYTHGSYGGDADKMAYRIVSNWCGHKRMFKMLQDRVNKKETKAKYFILFEDDVILDREWFLPVLDDFVDNYEDKSWDLLQLDPFGAKSHNDLVGHFHGKPVWKPTYLKNRFNEEEGVDNCKQYWGFQAIVLKAEALDRIVRWTSKQEAMPLDWMSLRMPNSLAFGAMVARNPEEAHYGRSILLPEFCDKHTMESTIAKNFRQTEGMLNLLKSKENQLPSLKTSLAQVEKTSTSELKHRADDIEDQLKSMKPLVESMKNEERDLTAEWHNLRFQAKNNKGNTTFAAALKEAERKAKLSAQAMEQYQDMQREMMTEATRVSMDLAKQQYEQQEEMAMKTKQEYEPIIRKATPESLRGLSNPFSRPKILMKMDSLDEGPDGVKGV